LFTIEKNSTDKFVYVQQKGTRLNWSEQEKKATQRRIKQWSQ